jgi:hypothetical protein
MLMNGKNRLSHKRVSIASRLLVGVATLAAGVVLLRSLPDLIRYMRARRM